MRVVSLAQFFHFLQIMGGGRCLETLSGNGSEIIRTSHHSPYTGDQVHGFGFHACAVIAGTEGRIRLRATPANCRENRLSVTLSLLIWEVYIEATEDS